MFEFDDVYDLPFFLDRSDESILRRYVEGHNEEYQDFSDKLEEVVESRQVDQAEGEELDRIGAAFGTLGRRRGRSDREYRIYLKSLVESFRGRGTVPGIISAIAAGLNIDEEDVEVQEDFQNLEYIVVLYDWTSHRGTTVEELSELADASVSNLKRTVYKIDNEEMEVEDSVRSIISTRTEDDEVSVDDLVQKDANKNSVTDSTNSDDSVVFQTQSVYWGEDWGVMYWG
jgi:hypothetical protein